MNVKIGIAGNLIDHKATTRTLADFSGKRGAFDWAHIWRLIMKRNSIFILVLFILIPINTSFAQNTVKSLDTLFINIWPDYDRASVLLLMTGSLPANTELPATVTLPFPETAQFNAIARIDSRDGNMKDDILSSPAPGEISFILPDLRFRLEYYLPYAVNNLRRSFDFAWLADITIDNLQLQIQQPISARSLTTEPASVNVVTRADGFVYHTFPTRAVQAGEPFLLQVNYTMTAAKLSAENRSPQLSDEQTTESSTESAVGSDINWAIVIGGLIVFAALAWQVASYRSSVRARKPPKERVEIQSKTKFCRDCGKPVDENDKFCGGCGREL
jgi:uncharacterized integral membrane protein